MRRPVVLTKCTINQKGRGLLDTRVRGELNSRVWRKQPALFGGASSFQGRLPRSAFLSGARREVSWKKMAPRRVVDPVKNVSQAVR